MKSKKLNKAVNAAFPIIAVFGGNALASNRGMSNSLSSKKGKNNSIVHVTDIDNSPAIPNLTARQKSPFSAFSHKKSNKVVSSDTKPKENTIEFLSQNNLLNTTSVKESKVSGETSRKKLAHDFTVRNNTRYEMGPRDQNACINPTVSRFTYYINHYNYTCRLSILPNIVLHAFTGADCYTLHNRCMDADGIAGNADDGVGHTHNLALPVELQEFEVE